MTSRGKLDRDPSSTSRENPKCLEQSLVRQELLHWIVESLLHQKLSKCIIDHNSYYTHIISYYYMLLSFSTAWLDWWLPTEILPLANRLKSVKLEGLGVSEGLHFHPFKTWPGSLGGPGQPTPGFFWKMSSTLAMSGWHDLSCLSHASRTVACCGLPRLGLQKALPVTNPTASQQEC